MSHPLEGVLKVIVVTATSVGAGATYAAARPAEGCLWEVLRMYALQNDGSVACGWYVTDTKETITRQEVSSCTLAANTPLHLGVWAVTAGSQDYFQQPMILSYQTYVEFMFTASAAAKASEIRAIVKEYRGVESRV